MKKTFLLLIVLAVVLGLTMVLVACNNATTPTDTEQNTEPEKPEVKTVIKIRYNNNDGSSSTPAEKEWSKTTKNPTRKRTGYDFVEWTFDQEGMEPYDASEVKDYLVQDDDDPNLFYVDLWAQWEKIKFDVTFVVGDRSFTQKVAYGESANPPSNLEDYLASNEVFLRWNDSYTNIVASKTITAITKVNNDVTVGFMDNGSLVQSYTGTPGHLIPSVPNLEKDGYRFVGWFVSFDGVTTDEQYVAGRTDFPNNNVTFVARWLLAEIAEPEYTGNTALIYGDTLELSAVQAKAIGDNITYSYSWLDGDKVLSAQSALSVSKLSAGSHEFTLMVTASAAGFEPQTNTSTVTVSVIKASLTAQIANQQITYGDPTPAKGSWDISFNGFVEGDDEQEINLDEMIAITDYQPGSTVATYRLSASGILSDNYNITVLDGSLTVVPRQIDISLKDIEYEYCGTAIIQTITIQNPANPNSSAVQNANVYKGQNDVIGDTIEVTYKTKDDVRKEYSTQEGSIDIVKTTVRNENNEIVTPCYSFTYDLSCEIVKATIAVSLLGANDLKNVYDGQEHTVTVKAPYCTTEYSTDGGQTFSEASPMFEDVGEYKFVVRVHRSEDYEDHVREYTYKITQAPLTIKATAEGIIYGDDPIMGFLVEGDTFGTLITPETVTLTTNYEVGDNIGKYIAQVALNEAAYPNFKFSYRTQEFLVTPKALTVTLKSGLEVIYGEALDVSAEAINAKLQALLQIEGRIEKDQDNDFIAVATSYKVGDVVKVWEGAITTSGENANYSFNLPTADVEVLKRDAVLVVGSTSRVYGESLNVTSWNYANESNVYGNDTFALTYTTTYLPTLSVGNAVATISATPNGGDKADNYNLTIKDGFVEVTKRALTIKVRDTYEVTYGNAFAVDGCEYDVTSGNFVNGDRDKLTVTYSSLYHPGSVVGSYDVAVAVKADSIAANYDITAQVGTLTVGKRALTIALDRTKAYKVDVPYARTFASEGLDDMFVGDNITGVLKTTSDAACTEGHPAYISLGSILSADFAWNDGFVLKNQSGQNVNDCYDVSYNLRVVISVMDIAHTVNDVVSVYDADEHFGEVTEVALGVTITYSTLGEYDAHNDEIIASFSGSAPAFTDVGVYTVYYHLEQTDKSPTDGDFTVTITKRSVIIELADKPSVIYGDAAPALTYEINGLGFVSNEHQAAAAIAPSTSYAQQNHVGTYPITASYTANPNYDISVVDATLTVSPKALTITLGNIDVIYGNGIAQSALDALLNVSGLTAWDDNFVTVGTSYLPGDGVKTYTGAVMTQGINPDYSFVLPTANVVVSQRTVTITADNATFVYGQEQSFSFTPSNVYGNDKIEGVQFGFANEDNALIVGNHTIIPSLANTTNYKFEFVNGTLTVTKAPLVVSATVPGITYGDAMPLASAFTPSFSGFVYNDTASVLQNSLAVSCAYATAPAAGSFAVTLSGYDAANYAISYNNATLTVAKKTLTLTVNAHDAITYNDPVPTDFGCVPSGLAYEDTMSVVTVKYTTAYRKGSNANATGYTFNVDASTSSAANYAIVAGAAKRLVVNKATPTLPTTLPSFSGKAYTGGTLESYGFALGDAWRWVSSSTVPNCGVTKYKAIYNPNSTNYVDSAQVELTVTLSKAAGVISANSTASATYSGSAIKMVSYFGASHNNTDGATLSYYCSTTDQSGADNIKGTDGGVYSITISLPATTNYTAATKTVTFSIKAVMSGSSYYTVEELNGKTSGTYILIGNAFVSSSVAFGGTLTLPYDGGSSNNITTDGGPSGYYVDKNEATYLKRKLTLKSGTLTINGTLNVGGIVNYPSQNFQGHTSGNYAQVTINSGANLVVNGTVDCYGYIKGDGELEVSANGTLKMPFVVRDFEGGTSTCGAYLNKNMIGAWFNNDPNGIAPFNIYEMPNVQVLQTIRSGGKVIGHAQLYADSKYNKTEANIIGKSGSVLNLTSGYMTVLFTEGAQTSDANLSKKYPTSCAISIYGSLSVGALELTVDTGIPTINTVTVSTSSVMLGIPYIYSFYIGSGSNITIGNQYKFLPGSSVTIASGATVTISGKVILYGNSWQDGSKPVANSEYPKNMGAATITVAGGTLNVNGTLAGTVYGEGSGGKIVTGSGAKFSLESKEGYGTRDGLNFKLNVTHTETQSNLLLLAGNRTAQAGKTYTYNGTSWN